MYTFWVNAIQFEMKTEIMGENVCVCVVSESGVKNWNMYWKQAVAVAAGRKMNKNFLLSYQFVASCKTKWTCIVCEIQCISSSNSE